MKIVFHLGVHCSDDDRLLRTLLKNRGRLAELGTSVPGPGRYRQVIRDALKALRGETPGPEVQGYVLEAVLDDDRAARVILSSDGFLGAPHRAVGGGRLYPHGADRARQLRQFFPGAGAEFHLGLRDPATFLPAVHGRADGLDWAAFLAETDPARLRWSEFIARLAQANPGVPITVWCNEDTPLIWPEVLRGLAGVDDATVLHGTTDLLATLMTEAGLRRMRGWMEERPPRSIAARRKVVAAFLDKFALAGAMEEEVDRPGWTAEYIAAMGAAYDADMVRVMAIPGVRFMSA